MIIEIGIPPSVNSIWRSGRRANGRLVVYRSDKHRKWKTAAGWELKAQRPQPIAGWVKVAISLGRTKRRSDADNRVKLCLDLLVDHGLLEDDSKVASVTVAWASDVAPGRVRIEVSPAQGPFGAHQDCGTAAARGTRSLNRHGDHAVAVSADHLRPAHGAIGGNRSLSGRRPPTANESARLPGRASGRSSTTPKD